MTDVDIRALTNVLNDIKLSTDQLHHRVGEVAADVGTVSRNQQATQSQLTQLVNEFRDHVRRTRLEANLQRAHTQIVQVEAQLEHEYGHYKEVRNTATGMLEAFDVGVVSEETVRQVAEELMLRTPRYWLAPALVALSAWAGNDHALCDKAVAEAFRRSPDHTALFFTLVLRRQERRESSLRWLRHYLNAQDPHALGREFAVVLESASQGAFGAAGRALLQETLERWSELLRQDDAARSAQVRLWLAELRKLAPPVPDDRYPRLAVLSPQWARLRDALGFAQVHEALLERYVPLLSEELPPSRRLEDTIDDLLDGLVTEYDPEELPLRRELALHQQIVAEGGDEDRAKAGMAARESALSASMDYLTLQSTAALAPWDIDVSPATRRLCIAACHEWFGDAHATLSRDYRQSLPEDVEARFSTKLTVGRRVLTLPEWTGSFSRDQEESEASLVAHWKQHTEPFLASLRYPLEKKLVAPVLVVLAVFVILLQANVAFGFLAGAAVASVWGLVLKAQYDAAERQRTAAESLIDEQVQESVRDLRAARAELADWETAYQAADAREGEARAFLAALSTAAHAPAPFEGRVTERSSQAS